MVNINKIIGLILDNYLYGGEGGRLRLANARRRVGLFAQKRK